MIRKLIVASRVVAALTTAACQKKDETAVEDTNATTNSEVAAVPATNDASASNMASTNMASNMASTSSMGSTAANSAEAK
jgi:hypothetical protein